MLYQVSFSALYSEAGEEPKQVKKVAYVAAESTTEASANLLSALETSCKDLNLTSVTINAISASPIKEVYFDDAKPDLFFKARVGFKDDETKKFKYEHWVIQADDLLNAVAKANQAAKATMIAHDLYNATITENIVRKELVGDYAAD